MRLVFFIQNFWIHKNMKLPFKNYYNYTMVFLLLYGFLGIAVSSYILWFVLPMGQGMGGDGHFCDKPFTGEGSQGNQVDVFGLVRYQWVEIHSWIGVVIAGLILIHLILHWRWIFETIKRVKNYILKRQKAVLERYITSFITLFILTAFEVLSGCVIWLILPRGAGDLYQTMSGVGRTFWGLQRDVWVDLHAWVAILMVAIIVIHLIMHWRWIINMTQGKMHANKAQETVEPEGIHLVNKPKVAYNPWQSDYLPRAGMFIGLVGAVCFLMEMLTFQLDWVGRYGFMLYLIPTPFISLMLARKWPYIGGALLIILGIAAIAFFFIFPVGIVWNQIGVWNELGLETIYTVVLVTLPLVISGTIFLIAERLRKRRIGY